MAAGFLLSLGGLGATGAQAASTRPAVTNVGSAICTTGLSPNLCMNRAGGGTSNGTPIIGWHQDYDNNEDFAMNSLGSDCGGWVHNGENGLTCPFAVGTGLNKRYDGDLIITLNSTATNKCATGDWPDGNLVLEPCSSSGVAYVLSPANYLINVYITNQCNATPTCGSAPQFVCTDTIMGDQLATVYLGTAGVCQWIRHNS